MNKVLDELVERYEIHSDMSGFGVDVRQVGFAYKRSCDDHYMIRLNTLPGMRFFLKRDSRGDGGWIIFSGMYYSGKSGRFFSPVGTGQRISSAYMKLKFSDLNMICYLRLSPKDFHYNLKVA